MCMHRRRLEGGCRGSLSSSCGQRRRRGQSVKRHYEFNSARQDGLTMAAMIKTPTGIIRRLRFRHHLAFSYFASSIGASLFSRSWPMDVTLVRRRGQLPFSLKEGFGGRGRKAAANQARHCCQHRGHHNNGRLHTKWKNETDSKQHDLHVSSIWTFPYIFTVDAGGKEEAPSLAQTAATVPQVW